MHAMDRMVLGFCMRGRGKNWAISFLMIRLMVRMPTLAKLFHVLQQLQQYQERSRASLNQLNGEFLLSISRTFSDCG